MEFYSINVEWDIFQRWLFLDWYSIILEFLECDLLQCWLHPWLRILPPDEMKRQARTTAEQEEQTHRYEECLPLVQYSIRLTLSNQSLHVEWKQERKYNNQEGLLWLLSNGLQNSLERQAQSTLKGWTLPSRRWPSWVSIFPILPRRALPVPAVPRPPKGDKRFLGEHFHNRDICGTRSVVVTFYQPWRWPWRRAPWGTGLRAGPPYPRLRAVLLH